MNFHPRTLVLLGSLTLAGMIHAQTPAVPQEPAPADAPKVDFAVVD